MPKIDLTEVPVVTRTIYPGDHARAVEGRSQQRLSDAAGLTQFGANLVRLAPGAASSLRHWHERQDELLMISEGTPVLIDDHGETPLAPGDICAFPAGEANGHHIVNRSDADAVFLVIGTRTQSETGWYSDVDMKVEVHDGRMQFLHRDGTEMDGTRTQVPAEPDFAAFSDQLSRALLTGDFDLYRTLWHLPTSVDPRNGVSYTLETTEALREDFEAYARAVAEQGVKAMEREIVSLLSPEVNTRLIEARVSVYDADGLIVQPFLTTFRMERRDGVWRVGRLISSLGHINWTLGRAGITEDQRFELD